MPRSPLELPSCQQRAGKFEGHRHSLVLGECVRQRVEAAWQVAARREQQTAAAGGSGKRPGAVEHVAAVIQKPDERLCPLEVSKRDEGFDLVRQEQAEEKRIAEALRLDTCRHLAEGGGGACGVSERQLQEAECGRRVVEAPGPAGAAQEPKRFFDIRAGVAHISADSRGEAAKRPVPGLHALAAETQARVQPLFGEPLRSGQIAPRTLGPGQEAGEKWQGTLLTPFGDPGVRACRGGGAHARTGPCRSLVRPRSCSGGGWRKQGVRGPRARARARGPRRSCPPQRRNR